MNNNKSTTWFTSDLHLGHRNIIAYCDRPWRDPKPEKDWLPGTDLSHKDNWYYRVDEMDATLIDNWNSVVRPNDTIYNLGDFTFSNNAEKYLKRLNGVKHLIRGNHDKQPSPRQGWASVNDYREIKIEGQVIVLMHYAMRVWKKSHKGAFQLYGHSHGTLPDDPNALSIDIGVDCHNYRPISFEEIKRIMAKKTPKPVDHHGR